MPKLKKFGSDYDWAGIRFPVWIKDIAKFQSRNKISINILAVEVKQVYICKKVDPGYDRVANPMIITENNCKHYVAIKSLSRLLSKQNSKHKDAQYFRMNCLQGFMEECSRDEHVRCCRNNEAVQIEMPTRKPFVKYSNSQYQFKVPFVMYADFVSILEPIEGPGNDPRSSSTRGINVHTSSG